MKELPERKPNRLKDYDYSQNGVYFVTVCTFRREHLFGRIVGAGATEGSADNPVGATVPGRPHVELTELGMCVDSTIAYYSTNNIIMFDKYVIMPNHIHLIIVNQPETGDRGRSPLQNTVRNLKSYVTKKTGFSPWQRSFYDHIIRNEQ